MPGGPPMHLTATGTEQRRALVLILHDSAKPATTIVHDLDPEGAVQTRLSPGQTDASAHRHPRGPGRITPLGCAMSFSGCTATAKMI